MAPAPPRPALAAARRLLLLGAVVLAAPGAVAETEQERHRAALAGLKQQIADLQERLRAAEGRKSEVEEAVRAQELRISRLGREIHHQGEAIAAGEERLAGLEAERHQVQAARGEQGRALAREVRSAYILSRQSYLKVLLKQGDPATLSRALTYYKYFNRARTRRLEALRERLERLARVQAEIRQEQARQQDRRAQLRAERERLESEKRTREVLLARLRQEIQAGGAELARLGSDRQRLEKLLADLTRMLADIPPSLDRRRDFAHMRGRLPWPAPGPIQHPFGSPRGVGDLAWQGVVLGAREGETVRAVHHGRVAFADWLRGYGLLVILDHGGGYMSLYGNNQALLRETGDWVEPGQPLAVAGTSGVAGPAGVYFEIRKDATPLNPGRWCASKRG